MHVHPQPDPSGTRSGELYLYSECRAAMYSETVAAESSAWKFSKHNRAIGTVMCSIHRQVGIVRGCGCTE